MFKLRYCSAVLWAGLLLPSWSSAGTGHTLQDCFRAALQRSEAMAESAGTGYSGGRAISSGSGRGYARP